MMHVSFRNRLTFFFILLVIVPVVAVATGESVLWITCEPFWAIE